jgi:N-acetylglucosamine kinase-like BadF-type ATPase
MKIGVDGGGTKTELILIDEHGQIVARHHGPGCNPSIIGPERACETLTLAFAQLLASRSPLPASITHTLLCMAGSPDFWREAASSLTGYGKIETTTDALPVLELATRGRPGLVLHAGTGSFVALRAADGNVHYAGGLGWRIGDPGSAQDIGRRAMARALAELQGWAKTSPLSAALSEEFGTKNASAITAALHRDAEPNQRIGNLAAIVSQLATAGDTAAKDIVLASTGELLTCAEASAQWLFGIQNLVTLRTGLSGPILTQPFVVSALKARTSLQLTALADPPIEGVRQLLLGIHNRSTI